MNTKTKSEEAEDIFQKKIERKQYRDKEKKINFYKWILIAFMIPAAVIYNFVVHSELNNSILESFLFFIMLVLSFLFFLSYIVKKYNIKKIKNINKELEENDEKNIANQDKN